VPCKTIAQCRQALKQRSDEFAKQNGKAPTYWPYWRELEAEEIAFSIEILQEWADVLGLALNELLELATSDHVMVLLDEDQES
jgi:hypothetical protein